jgi:phosphate starvation-inducible PhoH-like protein
MSRDKAINNKSRRKQKIDSDPSPDRKTRRDIKPLEAQTEAQGQLMSQIAQKDIVYSIGPAGTGKTYVSCALAAEAIHRREIERVIITRPMLACGENMGFLPGDEDEKYLPWVMPMVDVFNKRLGTGFTDYLLKNKSIQGSPLMTMRGSSFENAWIILDESQNTTPEQMKMFLTRIGKNCKIIINGDLQQSDLKDGRGVIQQNGLSDSLGRLRDIPEIGVVEFTVEDIVRHGIVRKILERY